MIGCPNRYLKREVMRRGWVGIATSQGQDSVMQSRQRRRKTQDLFCFYIVALCV
jgi:hypothetical protein